MGTRAEKGDLYYITRTLAPSGGAGTGTGDECLLVRRINAGRPEWKVALPDFSLEDANLTRRTVISGDEVDRITYRRMPEVTEQDMQALELMAEEQIRAVGGVAAPQPGPVPPAGGGGVGLAAGAYPALPGPTRGDPSLPPNYAHQHRSRYREGRGRRYFRRAKEKPVETVAGVAGFSLTVSKCVAFMKNHTIYQEYLVTFSIYWNYAKEGVLKAQSEVKEMGWDGILLTVIAVFFVLRVMSALLGDQSGPDPPQQPGGRPPGSFHYRPPYRPPGTPGGEVGDLADRIGNFQNINSQDHRVHGSGGPGGGGLF
jgi:hypothetical protein